MASLGCWSLCPKPKQVASETLHGAQLALQRLSRRCQTCDVEAGKPCKCGEEAMALDGGRAAVVEVNGEERHSRPNSTFAHSVINMVGMLIGTTTAMLTRSVINLQFHESTEPDPYVAEPF